jgi:hypothetical protein
MPGNAWIENKGDQDEDTNRIGKISMSAVVKERNDPWRLKILVEQFKKMEELEALVLRDRRVKPSSTLQECLAPLVIVVPFQFPTLDKVLGSEGEQREFKELSKMLNYEQAINYNTYTPTAQTLDDVKKLAQFQSLKAMFLDGVAYLHASFSNSTVIRFPLLGNSIKKELSFFKPETINQSKWENSKTLIDLFGKKLTELIVPAELSEDLFGSPRQIVAISDLPIEWMIYDGMNLCYSHDITRIPEMPYGGIMASYNVNSNVSLEIGEDIISRSLVLLGASENENEDQEFKEYFGSIELHSKALGYKTARCYSVKDVAEQIQIQKPDLLIFDCHGGFDSKSLSSYLLINGEKLTGEDIVKKKIVAPLIFLSACHTNPNYGYVNRLADAFFEAGCIAITATYFPISVRSGSNIYFRILRNLSNAVKMVVHKNWLEFVSHTLRTSYYKDVINRTAENINASSQLSEKVKIGLKEQLAKLNIETGLKMMRYNLRSQCLKEFQIELNKICPKELIDKSTVPEYPFYTQMGRGDLVLFSCWKTKFFSLNNLPKGNEVLA